ncbi:MAG TPA: TylF/MycF/NovP-related O-methyltransferase [Candidatus Binataceae bacterium]|nr:TylF/MycF/NovP-related O-methyltransferase [Candidatus Binataceae bacterium]
MMKYFLMTQLTRVGTMVSEKTVHKLNAALNYIETGRWLSSHGFHPRTRVRRDRDLFDLIIKEVAESEVLYLEFGVFEGESMRYWSSRLKNPLASLHGFDSFEGLPEYWNPKHEKGRFSTKGAIPELPDQRVKFFPGWFDQTLPSYVAPPHQTLVINMDADLYSSSIYVLQKLRPLIVPGTYIYFDEFTDRFHELRAFAEFVDSTGMKFDLMAANSTFSRVVFKRVGSEAHEEARPRLNFKPVTSEPDSISVG